MIKTLTAVGVIIKRACLKRQVFFFMPKNNKEEEIKTMLLIEIIITIFVTIWITSGITSTLLLITYDITHSDITVREYTCADVFFLLTGGFYSVEKMMYCLTTENEYCQKHGYISILR